MNRTLWLVAISAVAALAEAATPPGMLHTRQEFDDLLESGRFDGTETDCQGLKMLGTQTPVYSMGDLAKAAGGWVKLRILVNADGSVAGSWPVAAEPKGLFERASMAAVAYWQFEPCRIDGVPVGARAVVRINFVPSDKTP